MGAMTAGPHMLPTQRTEHPSERVHLHRPKIETFDLTGLTNTDPKGYLRPVDEYRVEPFGLYLARPMPGHPELSYLEAWLLPELGIRVNRWQFHPGHERDQDFYVDIGQFEPGPEIWRATDHYLDLVVRTGREVEVLDTDELLAASHAGLLDAATARRALDITYRAVDRIAAHGYDLSAWLAGLGLPLAWRQTWCV